MSLKNHGKRWDQYEDEKLMEKYREKLQEAPCVDMAIQWTAVAMERTDSSVRSRLSLLRYKGEDVPTSQRGTEPSEFAFYRGEKFVAMGTYKELSKITGLKEETLRFYATAAHKRRITNDSPIVMNMDEEDPIESR